MIRPSPTRFAARSAAVAAAAALALAGCSDPIDVSRDEGGSSDSASTAAPPDAGAGTDGSRSPDADDRDDDRDDDAGEPAVPTGYRDVDAPTTGVGFAVPSQWVVLESDDLDDSISVDAVAEAMGQTTAQVRAAMATTDLAAITPNRGEDGFSENILVNLTPSRVEPDEEILSQALSDQGLEPGTYSEASSGAGTLHRIQYIVPVPDHGIETHCVMLAVEATDGTWSSIVITTTDEARTLELADTVTSTLHRED